jgi:hypothetical protein
VTGSIVTAARPFILDAMTPIVEAIAAAGIRIALDLKDLNPPGCYLAAPELEFRYRAGDFTASYTLLAVARNTSRRLALAEIGELIVAVQSVLGERAQSGRPVDVPTNDGTAVLLGYEFSWHERVRQQINQP